MPQCAVLRGKVAHVFDNLHFNEGVVHIWGLGVYIWGLMLHFESGKYIWIEHISWAWEGKSFFARAKVFRAGQSFPRGHKFSARANIFETWFGQRVW